MDFEAVIGLEVHVQIKTASKMFTRVATGYGEPPNTLTDPTVLIWADGATFADEHPKAWQAISDVLAERVKGEPPFAFVLCEPKGKGRRR